MIANVGPCHMQYEDTHNTLKYANRAKNIKTKIVRNVLSVAHHISKYTQIIQDLRAEVEQLTRINMERFLFALFKPFGCQSHTKVTDK